MSSVFACRFIWPPPKLRRLLPNSIVNQFWHWPKALLANLIYGFPSRKLFVIGVTGTDGKTTTATLIYHLLTKAGKKAALISTVSAQFAGRQVPTGLHVTSPDSLALQKIIKEIVRQKIHYLVLESTSHGLCQNRLFGIRFQIGVLTNVTHEHLDYHHNLREYCRAKARLFKNVRWAILNQDDAHFAYFKKILSPHARLLTYSLSQKADFNLQNFPFKTPLLGDYNSQNCLAAAAAASAAGLSPKQIRAGLADFSPVSGRLEKIDLGQNFTALVDFAHTPNALLKVLSSLKKTLKKGQKLIVIFGCAGLRDKTKRPLMGKIAGRLAHLIVLTAEDPRTEDVENIIEEIAGGCRQAGAREADPSQTNPQKLKNHFFKIPDRAKAIDFAIQSLAQKGDIVVACGKGHEQSLCFGHREIPWSDQAAFKKALRKRIND